MLAALVHKALKDPKVPVEQSHTGVRFGQPKIKRQLR
jgi:hypothetical protein